MTKGKVVYADVAPAVPLPVQKFQTYTYRLETPDAKALHALVQVPFGRRRILGIVMRLHTKKPAYPVKPIARVFRTRLTDQQIAFGKWIARTMQGGLGFTLRLFLPPARRDVASPKQLPPPPARTAPTSPPQAYVAAPAKRSAAIKKIIKQCAKEGQQVLVLVPEVWMVDDLLEKYKQRGVTACAYHAGLSNSDQGQVWQDVAAQKVSLVVGTQKALFLPWQSLACLVLEEEYIPSHKLWDQYPRLDNRLATPKLAELHGAQVIYSSSFPSLALWHNIKEKRIETKAYKPTEMEPTVLVAPYQEKKRLLLPPELVTHMRQWVRSKQRVLVLYNKRGDGGIELMESIMHKLAFKGRVARLDAGRIEEMEAEEIEAKIAGRPIVLGTSAVLTQIGSQQFDRVVWLFPEIGMRYPDFRSYERAVALLGRLSQHLPSRRAVTLVTRQRQLVEGQLTGKLDDVYEQMRRERERLGYPPFADLVKLTIAASSFKIAAQRALNLREQLISRRQENKDIVLRGPYKGYDKRRGKKYEMHILLQGKLEDFVPLYDGLSIDGVDVAPQQVL